MAHSSVLAFLFAPQPSPGPCTNLPYKGRVFAHLIAELLVHADDQRVGRLDAAQSQLEAAANLGRSTDPPSRGQDLVNQARLASRSNRGEHARRIGRQINLAQRQTVAEQLLELLAGPGQIVEAA